MLRLGWHEQALLRPQFSREQVGDLELEETHVQNLMMLLEPMIGADGWIHEVDLQSYFFRLTLDVSTEFLFGESVNSQLQLLPGHQSSKMGSVDSRLAQAFDTAQKGLTNRIRFGPLYWLHSPKEFRDSCKIVHDFVDHFVKLALSKPQDREKDGEKYIFLDALVAETRDPIELRCELLHILLAGRDTTAAHLGWGKNNPSLPSRRGK
jgi:cytochrome P450